MYGSTLAAASAAIKHLRAARQVASGALCNGKLPLQPGAHNPRRSGGKAVFAGQQVKLDVVRMGPKPPWKALGHVHRIEFIFIP